MSRDAGVGNERVYAAVGGEICAADADGVDFEHDMAGGDLGGFVDFDDAGGVGFLNLECLQD